LSAPALVEGLESRRLLTALTVNGTSAWVWEWWGVQDNWSTVEYAYEP
jgi:hypothetical protein